MTYEITEKSCQQSYPVYTIEQTSSWLVQLTFSQLVEPARRANLIV